MTFIAETYEGEKIEFPVNFRGYQYLRTIDSCTHGIIIEACRSPSSIYTYNSFSDCSPAPFLNTSFNHVTASVNNVRQSEYTIIGKNNYSNSLQQILGKKTMLNINIEKTNTLRVDYKQNQLDISNNSTLDCQSISNDYSQQMENPDGIHENENQETFACKILLRKYFNDQIKIHSIERETRIQHFVNHSCIVRNHETLYFDDYIVLILDFCPYGDVIKYSKILGKIGLTKKIEILYRTLKALEYLHKRNIVHLDVKPDNIFMNKNQQAMLGDFGCSEVINESIFIYSSGTLCYASPEMILQRKGIHLYNYQNYISRINNNKTKDNNHYISKDHYNSDNNNNLIFKNNTISNINLKNTQNNLKSKKELNLIIDLNNNHSNNKSELISQASINDKVKVNPSEEISTHYNEEKSIEFYTVNDFKKCDIWSFGVTAYALITHTMPFEDENQVLIKDISKIPFDSIHNDIRDLILACVSRNPDKRPSASEFLRFPVFQNEMLVEKEPIRTKSSTILAKKGVISRNKPHLLNVSNEKKTKFESCGFDNAYLKRGITMKTPFHTHHQFFCKKTPKHT
ncbi:hypothetical protein TRFO_41528 [Tritrichomonas foetus]|uniref:Protein kinase domain-containing protein n=1 Tax=Tritrichomonas foetus TaxID=1144522 RepID=A0A1J4L054_9EUKA|nr:hypothetical protein TRFO_41528 [Tritrichomonas foetus]|eukprot:OHT16851.1 hypothetical protein TRFO_41528 [Tritrichomonas foetus]